ncbi:MAG: isocitrate lyase/phosphoenolpyruvate mutase family protein, partial [Rhodococcus sp. (in: high G+C Gram-positive bacteria)]
AIANPAEGDLKHFASLGVGRISFGPIFQMELAKRAEEILGRWK